MVRFIRSLFAPGEIARHDAASLIAAHGRSAIGKAHLACADAYVQADWKAFRQAGRVLDEVRRGLGRDAPVPVLGRPHGSASDPA